MLRAPRAARVIALSTVTVLTGLTGACAQHPGRPDSGTAITAPSAAEASTASEIATPSPAGDADATITYAGRDGDVVTLDVRFGDLHVGETGDVPAEAVAACLSNPRGVARALLLTGQATLSLTSSLPTSVRLKIGGTFDPVLLGTSTVVADDVSGSWQCDTGRLSQVATTLDPNSSGSFNFVLIAPNILTPNKPTPCDDLINGWQFQAFMYSGGLNPKITMVGPHVGQCTGDADATGLRIAVATSAPFQFRVPTREAFGVESGGLVKCAAASS